MREMIILVAISMLLALACAHEGGHRVTRQVMSSCDSSACVLTPEMTEGPYYWKDLLVRKDVREGHPGVDLQLAVRVIDTETCLIVPYAIVDIWHCDALGIYSHYIDQSNGGHGGTDNSTFLRGIQVTNAQGIAQFFTLFPGWYQGRTIHIHIKVHINTTVVSDKIVTPGHVSYTGQIFFNETISKQIEVLSPYKNHSNVRRLTNEEDGIYRNGGSYTLLDMTAIGGDVKNGLLSLLTVYVNKSATNDNNLPPSIGGPSNSGPMGPPPPASLLGTTFGHDQRQKTSSADRPVSFLNFVAMLAIGFISSLLD